VRVKFPSLNVFYVSYYARSKETMKIMFPDAHVYEDPRLAEAQRGIYHAMTREEIAAKYPEELVRKNREGLYHYRPFGGENWPDVELRIHSFLGTLARDYEGQDVLMVVHGHWLLLFQRLIHHFSIEVTVKSYQKGVFENASVTHYKAKTTGKGGYHLRLQSPNIIPWKGKI
jgi:broad specificity phosphatase PhoE